MLFNSYSKGVIFFLCACQMLGRCYLSNLEYISDTIIISPPPFDSLRVVSEFKIMFSMNLHGIPQY